MPTFVAGTGTGDNYGTILLPIVDVDWFKSALFGALFELTNPGNWIEMGDIAVSFAVEEAAKMIDGYKFMNFNPFPIGLMMVWPAAAALPAGYLVCDGSSFSTDDYPELFAVIGYSFGGSSGSFQVPDLANRVPIGSSGTFPEFSTGGEINHTLDVSEIPSHSHTIPLTATTLAVEPGEVTVLTPVPILTQNTGDTGGGSSHNNMQPYLALTYVIYAGRI